jgi:hypothetical protein
MEGMFARVFGGLFSIWEGEDAHDGFRMLGGDVRMLMLLYC